MDCGAPLDGCLRMLARTVRRRYTHPYVLRRSLLQIERKQGSVGTKATFNGRFRLRIQPVDATH